MIQYLIGIDGGGTGCRVRLTDISGQILAQCHGEPANILLGSSLVQQRLIATIGQAFKEAGLQESCFASTLVSAALAGAEVETARLEFESLPWPFAKLLVTTDAHGALVGAFSGGDGAIQIVGTGSCGLIKKGDSLTQIGGHEFPISDHCGGARLGLRAIDLSLLAHDQIIPESPFTHAVMARFNSSTDQLVQWSKTATPKSYGELAPLVLAYFETHDPVAIEIVTDALSQFQLLLKALINRGANRIALTGSIALILQSHLPEEFNQWIVKAEGDAMAGALLLARQAADAL